MRVRGERGHNRPSYWPSCLFVWRFADSGDLLSFSKKKKKSFDIQFYTLLIELLLESLISFQEPQVAANGIVMK